jgi:cyanophycinase
MRINRPMFAARACLVALVAVLLASALSFAVQPGQGRGQRAAPQIGPPNGALVIVGGAMRDPAIRERFIDLAGGPDAPIVVIPTAGGGQDYDEWSAGLQGWKRAGVTDITVLHTKDRAVADSEEFVAPLRRARGVWFNGGRQWHLADSYLDTRTHEELWGVLRRGGVIGGSSAGATIQGSYLARGDTSGNRIMMGDHTAGLGFLKNTAIDQHVLMRNRHFDLIEIIEQRPELLGIGIDENTAIVVKGEEFQVIGAGHVAIYERGAMLDSVGLFYFLSPGDRFDLERRRALQSDGQGSPVRPLDRSLERPHEHPLRRIERKPWSQR